MSLQLTSLFRLKSLSYDIQILTELENYPLMTIFYLQKCSRKFLAYTCLKSLTSTPTHHITMAGLKSVPSIVRCITIAQIFVQGTPRNTPVYHGIIIRPEEYLLPYEQFVQSLPKSFFKKLLFGNTQLRYKFQKMTKQNRVEDQECEYGNHTNWPPISYVPVMDEVKVEDGTPGRCLELWYTQGFSHACETSDSTIDAQLWEVG